MATLALRIHGPPVLHPNGFKLRCNLCFIDLSCMWIGSYSRLAVWGSKILLYECGPYICVFGLAGLSVHTLLRLRCFVVLCNLKQ